MPNMVKIFWVVIIALGISGCFKVGYLLEIGTPEQPNNEEASGYYYKSPSYYTR